MGEGNLMTESRRRKRNQIVQGPLKAKFDLTKFFRYFLDCLTVLCLFELLQQFIRGDVKIKVFVIYQDILHMHAMLSKST